MVNAPEQSGERDHGSSIHALHVRTYRDGEVILEEGEKPDHFFVILSGQVTIIQQGKVLRWLEDGDCFSLENFVLRKPSSYTARSLSGTRVAAYGQETFDHFIHEDSRMTKRILSSVLRQLMQTSQSCADQTLGFENLLEIRFYREGEVIIEEGARGAEFYKLISSQAGLQVSLGGKKIKRIERPGEFFGETASLLQQPYRVTVTSIGESVVEVYGTGNLELILKSSPALGVYLIHALASRIADSECLSS